MKLRRTLKIRLNLTKLRCFLWASSPQHFLSGALISNTFTSFCPKTKRNLGNKNLFFSVVSVFHNVKASKICHLQYFRFILAFRRAAQQAKYLKLRNINTHVDFLHLNICPVPRVNSLLQNKFSLHFALINVPLISIIRYDNCLNAAFDSDFLFWKRAV